MCCWRSLRSSLEGTEGLGSSPPAPRLIAANRPSAPTNATGSFEPTYAKDPPDPGNLYWCPDQNALGGCATIQLHWHDAVTNELAKTLPANSPAYSANIVTKGGKWYIAAYNSVGESKRVEVLDFILGY